MSYLIKWFFYEDLGFILLFYVVFVLSAIGLSSVCYKIVLFIILLQRFIYVGAIQISKVNMKDWSCGYSSHYIFKFVGFLPIYYTINLNIIFYWFLTIYILDILIYCKFESIIFFFLKKKIDLFQIEFPNQIISLIRNQIEFAIELYHKFKSNRILSNSPNRIRISTV